jgi:alpha-ketoglutarate-dependent 2,4-dichlorophenoxyacetate dioxygenase
MSLRFRELHPLFAAEVEDIDLAATHDEQTLRALRAGMDEYAVLVFRNQSFDGASQIAFSQRFDGAHARTSVSVLGKNRLGNEALTDISNVDAQGEIAAAEDRRRVSSLSNRLWHTDASFVDPPGRYSMLYAKVIPPVPADTEFADMRAAYDTLDASMRERIAGLRAHHSIVHSRHLIGFDFSPEEAANLRGAEQPIVRTIPGSGRKSLYLASHASHVVDWPVPEGRMLLMELTEHATRRELVYSHAWQSNDLVIWDNRATMHRARPFDDRKYRRELTRTTTLDLN